VVEKFHLSKGANNSMGLSVTILCLQVGVSMLFPVSVCEWLCIVNMEGLLVVLGVIWV
jgi:hypothetical protein